MPSIINYQDGSYLYCLSIICILYPSESSTTGKYLYPPDKKFLTPVLATNMTESGCSEDFINIIVNKTYCYY